MQRTPGPPRLLARSGGGARGAWPRALRDLGCADHVGASAPTDFRRWHDLESSLRPEPALAADGAPAVVALGAFGRPAVRDLLAGRAFVVADDGRPKAARLRDLLLLCDSGLGSIAPAGRDAASWLARARALAAAGVPLALRLPPKATDDEALLAAGWCLEHAVVRYLWVPEERDPSFVRLLLEGLELARFGINYVSCPTCGRCRQDLSKVVAFVKKATRSIRVPLTVAIMGCEVNGPGEAKHADCGVAASRGGGVLFRAGRVVRALKPKELAPALVAEVRRLAALGGGR